MRQAIHIGCEKTGTTSLQRYLFDSLNNVHYVGKYSDEMFDPYYRIKKADYELSEVREDWQKKVQTIPNEAQTILFSHEGITSTHISEQKEVARRMYEVFGDSKILLTIRSQQEISVSRYFNCVAIGYEEDFDSYMHRGIESLDYDLSNKRMNHYKIPSSYGRDPADLWSIWQYDKLIDAWGEYFSKVYVIPLEAWRDNPESVITVLSEFLNIPEGELSIPKKKARTRVTNFTPSIIQNFPGFQKLVELISDEKMDVEITDKQMKIIKNHYSNGNKKVGNYSGFALQELGFV